jgi:hypothetical protein
MVKENKKTEDIKAYQAAYRKANPKNKEATNEYMKKYIANAPDVHCPICQGHFKTYAKYKHDRSKKHLKALIDIKDKEEKAAAKKAEEEAVEKAKQEAEAKATTTATATAEASKTTKRPPKPTRPVPQPKKKREKSALEALQEYESSSEEEQEKKEVPTTKTAISFKLPNKKNIHIRNWVLKEISNSLDNFIDAEDGVKYKKHLSYKFGELLLKNGKNPLSWFMLPVRLNKTYIKWSLNKQQIKINNQ